MDCDSSSQETQTVRLVCHNPDAGCERLFEGGAEDTIVRLPEEVMSIPSFTSLNFDFDTTI